MEHEELHQNTDGLLSEHKTESLRSERDTGGTIPKHHSRSSMPKRNTSGLPPERNTESGTDAFSSMIILSKFQARFGLGLTALADETAIEEIDDALNDGNWQVRTAAVRRLGEIGGQTEVGLLVTRLQADEVAEVRAAAARALSSIRGRIPEAPLIAALQQDDDDVREAAALALASLGTNLSQQAIDALEDVFYGEPDEDTRATIVSALGQAGGRTPLEVLEVALYDSDWLVREAATQAMGRQKERADIKALEAMLKDQVQPVRDAATQALKQISKETRPTNKPHPSKQQ